MAGDALDFVAARRDPSHVRGRDPSVDGRFDLDAIRSRARAVVHDDLLKPAAVLLAIERRARSDRVLFTRRSGTLREHAGEICLPGGKRHTDDADPTATALREAFEEVGMPPDSLEPVALLDDVAIGGRHVVTPLVAMVRARSPLRIDPSEVERVFWVDVRDLRAPGVAHSWTDAEGKTRYGFALARVSIVGATARILHQALHPKPGDPVALDVRPNSRRAVEGGLA